ncbi:MAG: maleylpyruvate isomerase N-terminal domain-containing protein [Actinomycetota bacterium]|nr:maleylpyruvate isomerase N-terminal domain-containing protein [Actinomycetota bacterium]MDQ3527808.1 maleylpyruvate isomerase N-terminal domain-containing protein [Actinomycetota bacterium]
MPSCPDWSSADLVHHLAEVQDFWSQVVRGADGEDATDLPRPADDAALPDAYDAASGRLVAALEQADPTGSCWSWHETGTRCRPRPSGRWSRTPRSDARLVAHRPGGVGCGRQPGQADDQLGSGGEQAEGLPPGPCDAARPRGAGQHHGPAAAG